MTKTINKKIETKQQNIGFAIQNYGKRLFSFIRSRVNNNEDAEDILQDVWFTLSSIIDIESIEQIGAWLFRVSKNKIADKQRKQNTVSLEDFVYQDADGELVFPEKMLADLIDAEVNFESEVFKELLINALNELPENQRQVFIWNEMEDLTLKEIAEKTGENIKTIISRKRYAVVHLQKRLQNLYYN